MADKDKKIACITINTDASFHPTLKVGGYAFYIICDLFKITKGGMFKNHPKTPEEAEIMCIGNALATLLAQKELPEAKWLIINSDCQRGMEKIKRSSTPLGKQVQGLWQQLIRRLGSSKNKFRYVEAHQRGQLDKRSFVNDWCDKEAKKYMKIAAKQKEDEMLAAGSKVIAKIIKQEE